MKKYFVVGTHYILHMPLAGTSLSETAILVIADEYISDLGFHYYKFFNISHNMMYTFTIDDVYDLIVCKTLVEI